MIPERGFFVGLNFHGCKTTNNLFPCVLTATRGASTKYFLSSSSQNEDGSSKSFLKRGSGSIKVENCTSIGVGVSGGQWTCGCGTWVGLTWSGDLAKRKSPIMAKAKK